jgi:hypothetical protein
LQMTDLKHLATTCVWLEWIFLHVVVCRVERSGVGGSLAALPMWHAPPSLRLVRAACVGGTKTFPVGMYLYWNGGRRSSTLHVPLAVSEGSCTPDPSLYLGLDTEPSLMSPPTKGQSSCLVHTLSLPVRSVLVLNFRSYMLRTVLRRVHGDCCSVEDRTWQSRQSMQKQNPLDVDTSASLS